VQLGCCATHRNRNEHDAGHQHSNGQLKGAMTKALHDASRSTERLDTYEPNKESAI